MKIYHTPVLIKEILTLLDIKEGDTVVDCTIGEGGHSSEILPLIGKNGYLYGIDRDEEALEKAYKRLTLIGKNFELIHGNFSNILDIAKDKQFKVDKILVDLGISSMQIDESDRGFSFRKDGPLDMRMDKDASITAADIVNNFPENKIADIIYQYGEERFARRIAKSIVNYRNRKKIETTAELAEIVKRVYPHKWYRIHPATKTFQAIRIAVNGELEHLEKFLKTFPKVLHKNGRIAIISYHSLEDRLVKKHFKEDESLRLLNKKVIRPSREEILRNPRARSAKLRGAERL